MNRVETAWAEKSAQIGYLSDRSLRGQARYLQLITPIAVAARLAVSFEMPSLVFRPEKVQ
jgi:hypothetical protein